jgi:CPA2 family monovalent cation:H+ antiporter-2
VSASAFLTGYNVRTSLQTGMSLAQIGEFSFIIASVGLAAGAIRPFLYPVAIAVSAVTTLTTPWLIRTSGTFASFVDRTLPHRLQTFVALYGTWLARMRRAPEGERDNARTRQLVRILLLDALLLAGVIIGTSIESTRIRGLLQQSTGLTENLAGAGVFLLGALLATPLILGAVRSARLLGMELAARALPEVQVGKVDTAAAPRRVLVVTLEVGIILLVGVPIVAVTQPFVPPLGVAGFLLLVLAALGVAFWRSATNLHGHARAGAEFIVALLARQTATSSEDAAAAAQAATATDEHALDEVDRVLPGLGEPRLARVSSTSTVRDRTFAEVDLRGQTGATALAILRAGEPVLIPDGHDYLRQGDLVALAGTEEAVESATKLLSG